ncbi:MAG: DUF2786 domain-containing protein [Tistlia sp.]|uniref:DUF2786 domain-containing protein n=1 Tax=Tistlia sp. TaxID=3057121 RepID=UPI0034A5C916
MTESFTTSDKDRFRKLLLLAAESPFEGERAAALAAAERLAGRLSMTLEEAARASVEPEPEPQVRRRGRGAPEPEDWGGPRGWQRDPAWMHATAAGYAYEASAAASRARQRHRDKVEATQRREEEERRRAQALRRPGLRNPRRLAPRDFARTLILQTGFSLREIADITGLTQHEVIGLKLKLRG